MFDICVTLWIRLSFMVELAKEEMCPVTLTPLIVVICVVKHPSGYQYIINPKIILRLRSSFEGNEPAAKAKAEAAIHDSSQIE